MIFTPAHTVDDSYKYPPEREVLSRFILPLSMESTHTI